MLLDSNYKKDNIFNGGKDIIIPIKYKGKPKPEFNLEKPEKSAASLTVEKTNIVLNIQNSSTHDTGAYKVSAKNEVGKDDVTLNISIIDKPSAPREFQAIKQSKTSIGLSWEPPENNGGSPITKYVLEMRESSRRMWSECATLDKDSCAYDVTRLKEGNEYMFRLAAENIAIRGHFASLGDSVTVQSLHCMLKINFYLCS